MQDEYIDAYIDLTAKTRNLKKEDVLGYENFMKTKLAEKNPQEQKACLDDSLTRHLVILLMACAKLDMVSCPMESFDSEA